MFSNTKRVQETVLYSHSDRVEYPVRELSGGTVGVVSYSCGAHRTCEPHRAYTYSTRQIPALTADYTDHYESHE